MNSELTSKQRGLIRLVFVLYIALLLKVLLFKLGWTHIMFDGISLEGLQSRLRFGTNLIPFKMISYYLSGDLNHRVALQNLVGNIAAFGPLGFLVPLAFPKLRNLRQVAGTAFGVSLSIEVVQLLVGWGSFDIDDLLLNVLGAIGGWLLYQGLAYAVNRPGA